MPFARTLLIACLWLWTLPLLAEVVHFPADQPLDLPRDPNNLEGPPLVIYGATDLEAMRPLIVGFQETYPGIAITYHELNTVELYDQFLEEVEEEGYSADLILSSAMDLQIKLVNDGYARPHVSLATRSLPDWAVWRDEAFGFTYEPAVMVYNKQQVPPEEIPQTRRELVQLLLDAHPERYTEEVATYDPERSGVGFLLATQDAHQSQTFWDLVRSLGKSSVKLYTNTGAILERIADGHFLIGYNLLGSYAQAYAKRYPSLGIVLPRDYTLVMSRIVFIPKSAPQHRLAGLFLDFLLGEAGQRIIAGPAGLYAIHPEVTGELTARQLQATLGPALRPIRVGPGLLVYLDQAKRRKFLRQWQRALSGH